MSYDPEELALREEVASISIQVYQRGLVAGAGGNVSARLPGRDQVLITPTGVSLGMTTVDNIVKTDMFAKHLDSGNGHRPSKETGFHCAIYRMRPEVNAIVHVHPPYTTAFSLRFEDLPLVTVSATANLKRVPCVDVALSGSDDLKRLVEEGFERNPGVRCLLMRAHGIISIGPNLVAAYNGADLVEDTAKIAHLSAALGVPLEDSVEVAFRTIPQSMRV
ncbi:MAG TPA: class II aldolase/adducin family protein [Chloroflexota bacterium]